MSSSKHILNITKEIEKKTKKGQITTIVSSRKTRPGVKQYIYGNGNIYNSTYLYKTPKIILKEMNEKVINSDI